MAAARSSAIIAGPAASAARPCSHTPAQAASKAGSPRARIAAMRARGLDAFEAASAGVWLHGRAAETAGPHMIADDLVAAIPAVL